MNEKRKKARTVTTSIGIVLGLVALAGISEKAFSEEAADAKVLDGGKLLDGFITGAPGQGEEGSPRLYLDNCASCHGANLEGSGIGSPLIGKDLKHGETFDDIVRSIEGGYPKAGMPSWSGILSDTDIRQIALYVTNYRAAAKLKGVAGRDTPVEMPTGVIETEKHDLKIEMVLRGFHNRPFSIEPMPDGRLLLTEKMLGLSVVSKGGTKSAFVSGAPRAYNDSSDDYQGLGWLLDVAVHPEFATNGWIYLHYTDRCEDCNAIGREKGLPVSMNKIVRGCIRDGAWVDQQVIWATDVANYTSSTDVGAGGRLAFDGNAHLFFSIGIKSTGFLKGVQDLSKPYGKIFRLNDDSSIPEDNPYFRTKGALKGIWTLGHRSPQGLEFDRKTGSLWGTEQGPMGGDELNLLIPGGNFGWPLTSRGLNYNGTAVDHGNELGIEWKQQDIQQPVFDFTPSPAVSGLLIYDGDEFPEWKNNMFVTSLKAQSLYRLVMEGDKVVHAETVVQGLGRIRDIEMAPDGAIYLLLENVTEGQIIKLVNATN